MTEETVTLPSPRPIAVPRFGLADAAMLLMMVGWGLGSVIIKVSVAAISPILFTTIRHLVSSFILIAIMALRGTRMNFTRREWVTIVILSIIGVTAQQSFLVYAFAKATVGDTVLLIASTPVIVAVINHLLGWERLSGRAWLGAIVSFVGIGLIVAKDGFGLSAEIFLGDIFGLLAALTWAIYTVMSQPLLARHDSLALSTASVIIGTILLAVLAWPGFVAQDWRAVSPGVWLGTAYSTVVAVALGYVVWNWAVQKLGGARASLYANVVPVIGLVMGVLLLRERLTLLGMIGAAATLGGIYLSRSSVIDRQG